MNIKFNHPRKYYKNISNSTPQKHKVMKQHYEDPVIYKITEAFPCIKGIGIILHNTTCNPYHVHHLKILSMIRIGSEYKIRPILVLSYKMHC